MRVPTELYYTFDGLDRSAELRVDVDRWAALWEHADREILHFWETQLIVDACELDAQFLRERLIPTIHENPDLVLFLGLVNDRPYFAVDHAAAPYASTLRGHLGNSVKLQELRALVGQLSRDQLNRYATARGLIHWHRTHQFCSNCGARTQSEHGGHLRRCSDRHCQAEHYPQICPAILALVISKQRPDYCFLAQHRGSPDGTYWTLAGFVEVGENFESAVRRELYEEARLQIDEIRYVASQAWPFPRGLMIGYLASAVDEAFEIDGIELVNARWFHRSEIQDRLSDINSRYHRPDSMSYHLLHRWAFEVGFSPWDAHSI